MNIRLVLPEEILSRWSEISPYIQEAIDKGQGENSLLDHARKLLHCNTHCWLIEDQDNKLIGVGITEFMQYAQYKVLHIVTLTGKDFESWGGLVFPRIEGFAKAGGAAYVEQWGRTGWTKVLPKIVPGFEQTYVVMRKKIGDE